jgi:hypothetical protein
MSYDVDLSNHDPAAARALVEQVVEDWRGVIEQDTLKIPSQSGLRRGVVAARLGIERLGAHGSRVTLEPTEEWLEVHLASVVILLIGAIGGIGMVFWPFFPRLTPVMPVAFLTTLGAWFLVASRLGQVGLAELADAIRRAASAPSE